jgi:hypothetical protein
MKKALKHLVSINTLVINIYILFVKIKFKMLKVSIFALVFLVTISFSHAREVSCRNHKCPKGWTKAGKSIPSN